MATKGGGKKRKQVADTWGKKKRKGVAKNARATPAVGAASGPVPVAMAVMPGDLPQVDAGLAVRANGMVVEPVERTALIEREKKRAADARAKKAADVLRLVLRETREMIVAREQKSAELMEEKGVMKCILMQRKEALPALLVDT